MIESMLFGQAITATTPGAKTKEISLNGFLHFFLAAKN